MHPLIGIPCSTAASADNPPGYHVNQAYARAVEQTGGVPILIPLLSPDSPALRALYDALDGILLPGGADLQPQSYGATPHPKLGSVDPNRDATELALARWALAESKPILGICRGQQCLNVAAGGSLFQDIASEIPGALIHRHEPRGALAHHIRVDPASALAEALGSSSFDANSLHHQAVKDVAPGFIPVAWAPDGVIEGMERRDHPFALAVQFHPEELVPGHEPSECLLRSFADAAAHKYGR
ncbi:MAG TPA: gamma-glutamyl-gamma-aminobutyrate hydrolase family protein [Chloroflexota bacterium]